MTRFLMVLFLVSLIAPLPPTQAHSPTSLELLDLQSGQTRPLAERLNQLGDQRIILVGEHHTAAEHHRAQLAVIQTLVTNGRKVAVGMEMFRSDSQANLDGWVAGRLAESEFKAVYADNWNYPWHLYQPILVYARQNRLPLVGLNVPREITRRVAHEGFAALSAHERRDLPFVTCDVDADYMAYIRQAHGAHGHGQMNFTHFCEAQLVWDKSMAVNALHFLDNNPDYLIVVLAGAGHVRKGGIPAQLGKMTSHKPLVLLPAVPGGDTLDHDDADYLIRGFYPG